MTVVLVAVAGAAGALSRYGLGHLVGPRTFPWTTLGINLVGSFLLGVLWRAGLEHRWSDAVMTPLGLGFLGAFTTFSTFSFEVTVMLRDGRASTALVYVLVSLVAGVLVAAVG